MAEQTEEGPKHVGEDHGNGGEHRPPNRPPKPPPGRVIRPQPVHGVTPTLD